MRRLVLSALTRACLLAPLGSLDTGAGALQPGPGSLCSRAPPAW